MGAAATVFLLVGGYIPFMSLTFTAIAGLFIAAIFIECGMKYAFLGYLTASGLSFIAASDKTMVFLFIFFFGLYPIYKSWAERRKTVIMEFVSKFLFLNAMLALSFLLIKAFATLPKLPDIPFAYIIAIFVVNGAFFIYDLGFSKLIVFYRHIMSRRK